MRQNFQPVSVVYLQKFFTEFREGFQNFVLGDWESAKRIFSNIDKIKGSTDGPSENLLRVMQEFNYKIPAEWEGFHELKE